MQQFLVIAHDAHDEFALQRRMDSRSKHFEKARALKASGNFVVGGAILDDRQKMIGSMMVVQFESMELLQQWLAEEPYVFGKIWDSIEIKPFRLADV